MTDSQPHANLFTAWLCGALAVVLPQSSARNTFLLAAMALFVLRFLSARTLDPSRDFGLAMIATTYIFQIGAIAFSNMDTLRARSEPADGGVRDTPARKLRVLLNAFTNPRWINWSWQRTPPPLGPRISRTRFLLRRLAYLIAAVLATDACQSYFHAEDWFVRGAWEGEKLTQLPTLLAVRHAAVWVVFAYILWFLPYVVLSAVQVAIGACATEDFPELCSSFTEAYTVRNFWGKVWHQSQRNTYVVLGHRLNKLLFGNRRTLLSRYTLLWTAFAVSGLVHAAGSYSLPPDKFGYRGCEGTLIFFSTQFMAICVEDAVVYTWKTHVGTSPSWARALGYAWVAAQGTLALVWSGWLHEMVSRRSLVAESLPFSLVRGITNGQWLVQ